MRGTDPILTSDHCFCVEIADLNLCVSVASLFIFLYFQQKNLNVPDTATSISNLQLHIVLKAKLAKVNMLTLKGPTQEGYLINSLSATLFQCEVILYKVNGQTDLQMWQCELNPT